MPTIRLNDQHSQLNETTHHSLEVPKNLDDLTTVIQNANRIGTSIIPHGSKHAMGSQQFLTNGIAVDLSAISHIHSYDFEKRTVTVGSGATWIQLRDFLRSLPTSERLAIRQKQTGADALSIGGALSANIHGRGLTKAPIVEDIESFVLVSADGSPRLCSRSENPDLFALAIGGYGLFGIVYEVTLRLCSRHHYQRHVALTTADQVVPELERRAREGHVFGDFQFNIDHESPDFLETGILSSYSPSELPVSHATHLKKSDWLNLLELAHRNKSAGFNAYSTHYQSTHGEVYDGDDLQFTTYIDDYHSEIDQRCGHTHRHTEMISEFYVPRDRLSQFLRSAATSLRNHQASVIYGTIRLIEKDKETTLAWAREPWACIVLNLCVEHSPSGLAKNEAAFQALADIAIDHQGSFYLTYHGWFRPDQFRTAHAALPLFKKAKSLHDPYEIFTSNWWNTIKKYAHSLPLPSDNSALDYASHEPTRPA